TAARRNLPSFPTRRSSDLAIVDHPDRTDRDAAGEEPALPGRHQHVAALDGRAVAGHELEPERAARVTFDDAGGASSQYMRADGRSEEHTSELQSRFDLVCR